MVAHSAWLKSQSTDQEKRKKKRTKRRNCVDVKAMRQP